MYVIPGGTNLGVHESDGVLKIRLVPPEGTGVVLTPSADHMLKALSPHLGDRLCVVVLTGMGSDGTEGARVARKNGARVYVEDPATAVMPGMPQSVVSAGLADRALPLERLHEPIVAFDRSHGRRSDAGD